MEITSRWTATHDGVNLRAEAWRNGKVKSFIGTCGTTVAGVPQEKNRWRNNNNSTTDYFTVEIPRPGLACNCFDGAQAIDVHNHSRQGQGLGLQVRPTNRWQICFWQIFIGITQVDAHDA